MTSLAPLWWLALPVLLLPVLWHRRKAQRDASELLATARFLPSSAPQLHRVWRWTELVLLALRLLLLVTLIAWLAVAIVPWRSDTVLADPSLDPQWTARQIQDAGMAAATRAELPGEVTAWIVRHEHEFRRGARVLVLARDGALPMPATVPAFLQPVDIRTGPPALPAAAAAVHRVVLATQPEREATWRALFAAFGAGGERYVVDAAPVPGTELIVWDRPDAPPADWKAAHWWRASPSGKRTTTAAGLALAYGDTPQGRMWSGMPWPPASEREARAAYDAWQQVAVASRPYPLGALQVAPTRAAPLPLPGKEPAPWLAWALLVLFILERVASHARRR